MKNLFYLIVFTIFSLSCGEKKEEAQVEAMYDQVAVPSEEAMMESKSISAENGQTESADIPIEQKIIKTGYFTFETNSVESTFQSIKNKVGKYKGYIQNDETSKQYDRIKRSLVIRIPTIGFQPVVDSISKEVKVFDEQKIDLQDVTEEFVDLESRMKAKKELENRYLQILSKANTVKDILEIEAQLAQIREEIEAKEGRLKYLKNQVSFSTLNISFYEIIPVESAPSQSYFNRLWNAVTSGFYGIGEFFIGILTLWPLIFVGVIVVYFVRKRLKNRKTHAKE